MEQLFNENVASGGLCRRLIDRLSTPYGEVIILLMLIAAGSWLRYHSIPPYQVIAADGPSYINITREILSSHTAKGSIHYPPFYPFLIAIASLFTRDLESAGVMVSLVMGSLLVVPVFLLGRALFGRGTGYVSAVIAVVWPEFVGQSSNVLAYSTYFTLLISGLYLLWKAYESGKTSEALLSGLFIAAAYLSRQEAFISMAVICGCLAGADFWRQRSLARLKPIIISFVTFFLLIFPYIFMVHQIMGFWTLAGKSVVTLTDCLGYYLQKTDLNRDPNFVRIGIMEIIRDYPGYFPYTMKANFAKLIDVLPDPLLVFAGIGLFAGQRKENALQVRLFCLAALFPVLILLAVFIVSGAYIAPYMPFMFMLCGYGMISAERYLLTLLKRWLPGYLLRTGLLTAIAVSCYAGVTAWRTVPHSPPPPYSLEMDGGRYDHKLMGYMLRKMIPEGTVIMTRSGRIGFYSGLPWVDIPQTDLDTILKTARDKKVRFLIVDGLLLKLRPQLGALLDPLKTDVYGISVFDRPEEVMPGLYKRVVYTAEESQGLVVYEFNP